MKLDEIDKRIINALIQDSRQSYRSLAKEAKVSIVTISNRMKQFKKLQFIKGYTTLVDYDKMGYDIQVIIEVRVSQGKESLIEKELLNSSSISTIYDITGDHDILLIARFKNRRDLDKYLKQIQTLEFVERVKTSLILDAVKENPTEIR